MTHPPICRKPGCLFQLVSRWQILAGMIASLLLGTVPGMELNSGFGQDPLFRLPDPPQIIATTQTPTADSFPVVPAPFADPTSRLRHS